MSVSKKEILEALSCLDINDPKHWTTNGGLPRLDVLKDLTGKEFNHKQVTEAAPSFCLENPVIPSEDEDDDDSWLEGGDIEDEEESEQPDTPENAPADPAPEPDAPEEFADEEDREDQTNAKAELEKRIEEAEKQLRHLKQRKADTERDIRLGEDRLKRLGDELRERFPPLSAAEATRAYLDQQLEQRRRRVEGGRRVQNLMRGEGMAPLSPLDEAMRRKSGYGRARPQFPVKDEKKG